MKVLVQNLQKRSGLASDLTSQYEPDVVLSQEISWGSEMDDFRNHAISHTSVIGGYGTAIYVRETSSSSMFANVRKVLSPHPEFGGFIYKKTILANSTIQGNIIQLVSFHGYNGQPWKNVDKLVDHVRVVVEALDDDMKLPTIFAGDFNTWTDRHLEAVTAVLESVGFQHACSWEYPGRDFPLDHVFLRKLELIQYEVIQCSSDHRGALLEISPSQTTASAVS
jgi:hypothetical protein